MAERTMFIGRKSGRLSQRVLDAVAALATNERVLFVLQRHSQKQHCLNQLAYYNVPKQLIERIDFITHDDIKQLLGQHLPIIFDERLEIEGDS